MADPASLNPFRNLRPACPGDGNSYQNKERALRIPTPPTFSERYKAQVEAERQYVLYTQQQAKAGHAKHHSGLAGDQPEAPATVEEAFRSIFAESRKTPPPSPVDKAMA